MRKPLPSRSRSSAQPDREGVIAAFGESGGLDLPERLGNPFRVAADEVHVWCASLEQSPADGQESDRWLSIDERERAARLRFERDRGRFIRARAILRRILGRYLACEPAAVQFSYGRAGKPRLAPEHHSPSRIEFNVSHSEGLALYAVTSTNAVGVDLERIREIPDASELAARHFSAAELERFRAAEGKAISMNFLQGWTRTEARLKAQGVGLGGEATAGDEGEQSVGWSVIDLGPAPGYVGALAVRTTGYRIRLRRFGEGW